jgi:hypothetical protein
VGKKEKALREEGSGYTWFDSAFYFDLSDNIPHPGWEWLARSSLRESKDGVIHNFGEL